MFSAIWLCPSVPKKVIIKNRTITQTPKTPSSADDYLCQPVTPDTGPRIRAQFLHLKFELPSVGFVACLDCLKSYVCAAVRAVDALALDVQCLLVKEACRERGPSASLPGLKMVARDRVERANVLLALGHLRSCPEEVPHRAKRPNRRAVGKLFNKQLGGEGADAESSVGRRLDVRKKVLEDGICAAPDASSIASVIVR